MQGDQTRRLADLTALADRLTSFEPPYNATATAFDWRFGRTEPTDMLARITAREHATAPTQPPEASQCPDANPTRVHETSLGQRLTAHARQQWPILAGVGVRFRGQFAYISAHPPVGDTPSLCQIRYTGSARTWAFAICRASRDNSLLPTGAPSGPPRSPRLRVRALPQRPPHRLEPDTPTNLQA